MQIQPEELLSGADPIRNLEVYDRIGCELIAQSLRAGGQARVRVMGTSMVPALWPGDILIIRGGEVAPCCGEILVFLRCGRLFAHRVVRTTGAELITRGDALPECDPPVSASEVLGVAVGIVRDGSDPVAATPLSWWQAMVAFAIRRSDVVYRMVLRAKRLSRYLLRARRPQPCAIGKEKQPTSTSGVPGNYISGP